MSATITQPLDPTAPGGVSPLVLVRDGRPALEGVCVASLLSAGLPGLRSDSAVRTEALARYGPPDRATGAGAHARTLRDEEPAADFEYCLEVSTVDGVPEVTAAEPFRAGALARRAGVIATAALEHRALR